MKIGQYLLKIRSLMELRRYQNVFLHKRRSVAEHSWSVAKISQMIALREIHENGTKLDMGVLLQKALCHDELEMFTGDFPSHTKRRTESMTHAVNELESIVYLEDYLPMIDDKLVEKFEGYVLDAKDGSVEGKILAAADLIDTIFEALDEVKLGNKEYMVSVYTTSVQELYKSPLKSVQDFIEQEVPKLIIGTDLVHPKHLKGSTTA
ncbi:YfbR-like 5'-deoxynucleotidase [Lysinibacillus sp. UGB7]|uniref:YfbR-like 5'-deoxynucleotidase n=1 Tax=Lysinibacillus sp. UGB7 TaxID=3411039 RepID=UPI003B7812E9